MGKRTKARECALQMLYQWDVTREPMDRVAGLFWQVRTSTDETRAMAERLARGAQAEMARLDEEITRASHNWRFERIAAIDKNILRLAVYELLREPGTPSSVVIDEAVELAKRFSEGDSPPFVNGVLDAIKARVRGEPAGEARARGEQARAKKEKDKPHE
jgi:N utilization substance protein B